MFNSKKNLEILRKAFDVIAREEAKALPTPEECTHITFSEEFEQKMQKLIKRQAKSYYYLTNTVGKRVACVIIALLLAITSVTFGVKAIREAVIDFFVETFEKFSIVGFKDEDVSKTLDHIETYYAPTYIPEGYELKKDEKILTYRRMHYMCGNDYIEFRQNTLQLFSTYIDTEASKTESVSISGNSGFFSNKKGIKLLYWNDSSYSYFIQSESDIAKEELIKIAESIKAQ